MAKWYDVRASAASTRPRMNMPFSSVEASERRFIYDARKLNVFTKKKPFPIDTVARAA